MKTRKLMLAMTFSLLPLLTYNLKAQTGSQEYRDTSQNITKEELKIEKAADKERMDNAKEARKQTRSDTRVTQQKHKDAIAASKESRRALRDEKKAQSTRKDATTQAQKAAEARQKSDRN